MSDIGSWRYFNSIRIIMMRILISNQIIGLLLIAALLSNTVLANGLSTCHCSISTSNCCCSGKNVSKSTKKCCCQKSRDSKNCHHCQKSCKGSSCQCGCQNRIPAPVAPVETSQNRLQIEFFHVSSLMTTLVDNTMDKDGKKHDSSSGNGSSIPLSVQLLCCTWLT